MVWESNQQSARGQRLLNLIQCLSTWIAVSRIPEVAQVLVCIGTSQTSRSWSHTPCVFGSRPGTQGFHISTARWLPNAEQVVFQVTGHGSPVMLAKRSLSPSVHGRSPWATTAWQPLSTMEFQWFMRVILGSWLTHNNRRNHGLPNVTTYLPKSTRIYHQSILTMSNDQQLLTIRNLYRQSVLACLTITK